MYFYRERFRYDSDECEKVFEKEENGTAITIYELDYAVLAYVQVINDENTKSAEVVIEDSGWIQQDIELRLNEVQRTSLEGTEGNDKGGIDEYVLEQAWYAVCEYQEKIEEDYSDEDEDVPPFLY